VKNNISKIKKVATYKSSIQTNKLINNEEIKEVI